MNETTEVDMNAICAYCGKPKFRCLCGCTVNIPEWRKKISLTSDFISF